MKRPGLDFLLATGFFALAIGILVARNAPASAYESSIYTGTPSITWVTLSIALAIAVGVTLATRGKYQGISIALGGLTVTTIVSLPVIRTYRYIGMGDALTHLGWVRDFLDGSLYPHELFYPGLHSMASVVHLLAGSSPERSILITVSLLFVPFVIFVPLIVRDITGTATAVGAAAIVSWMVLPINNVATHMGAHTNSNALFFVPVVIFAYVAYSRRRTDIETFSFGLSPFSVLGLLTGTGLLLIHPQQMVNVVILLGAISIVQFLAGRRYDEHPILQHRSAYGLTAVLAGVFLIWAASNERFRDALSGLIYGLFAEDIGASSEVGQREGSLVELGGSLGELFVKMFLVSFIIGLIVGTFVLLAWLGRTAADRETKTFLTYFAIALVPLTGMFLVYFVGTPTMAFRQVGFIYVLLTILAGIALAHGFGKLSGIITTPGGTAVAAMFFGACLVLALLTVFSSPFIYQPTQHVTDQQYHGYESAFEMQQDGVPYAGLGSGTVRFGHGINGVESGAGNYYQASESGAVEPEPFNAGNYSGAYPTDEYYFVVTEYDVSREIGVYLELHYNASDLEQVETKRNANKVLSNDQFRLYEINAGG